MDIRKTFLFLVLYLFLPCLVFGENVPQCLKEIKTHSNLGVAVELLKKVKDTMSPSAAIDCEELLRNGYNVSEVYTVFPKNRVLKGEPVEVYCDMTTDGGGWTVIQRRGNYMRKKENFFQDWNAYKEGFGNLLKDFWLGNDKIFALSNQKLYSIRFDLRDAEGNVRFAEYDSFWIDDEDHKYTLHIKGYRGDAEDAMTYDHDNQKFSTKDQDNDSKEERHCAQVYKGGWWYGFCHAANLNGLYQPGKHETFADGMIWYHWKGHYESLEFSEIKIRSKGFRKSA